MRFHEFFHQKSWVFFPPIRIHHYYCYSFFVKNNFGSLRFLTLPFEFLLTLPFFLPKNKVGEQEKWDKDIFFLQKILSRRRSFAAWPTTTTWCGCPWEKFGSRAGGEHAMNQLQFSSDLRVFMIQIPGSSEWPFGFWHFQGWILERPFRKTHWKTEK